MQRVQTFSRLHPAVDQGAHALEVGLEPPRPHVVGVGDAPADHRPLATDIATLRHNLNFLKGFQSTEETLI